MSDGMLRTISPAKMVGRWTSDARPKLFRGELISTNTQEVCRCAQGDVLHCAGYTDRELLDLTTAQGDLATAKALGISVTHSVLLRNQNDHHDGCPQDVLSHPERILGPHARLVLAFWLRLDQADWAAIDATRFATWDAVRLAALSAAIDATRFAVWQTRSAAGDAARSATWSATWATWEIQGHELLQAPLFFLPFFGIHSIDELQAEADAIVLA